MQPPSRRRSVCRGESGSRGTSSLRATRPAWSPADVHLVSRMDDLGLPTQRCGPALTRGSGVPGRTPLRSVRVRRGPPDKQKPWWGVRTRVLRGVCYRDWLTRGSPLPAAYKLDMQERCSSVKSKALSPIMSLKPRVSSAHAAGQRTTASQPWPRAGSLFRSDPQQRPGPPRRGPPGLLSPLIRMLTSRRNPLTDTPEEHVPPLRPVKVTQKSNHHVSGHGTHLRRRKRKEQGKMGKIDHFGTQSRNSSLRIRLSSKGR